MPRYIPGPSRAAAALLLGIAGWQSAAGAAMQSEWNFRVYLDDRAIGHHRFSLTRDSNAGSRVVSEASYDVTVLKLPVYRYRHRNVEVWRDRCLASISSSTDENGRLFSIEGTTDENGFLLTTRDGDRELPACIATFAYWDRSLLKSGRLLNAQTGEYTAVSTTELGEQVISVRQSEQLARRYRLDAGQATIDLWYSEHGDWLALESVTAGGRVLRYVLE